MSAPVVHFEILGKDGEKLKGFYKKLFQWKINSKNPMKYGVVEKVGKGIGGGIATVQEGMPPMVTFYIAVKNVALHLKKIEKLGGKTIVPETVIPNMVTFGLFADPEGNIVGLVKDRL